MKGLFLIIIASFTIAVGCYDRTQAPPTLPFAERATMTIRQLRDISTHSCREINSEVICVGRVTSSDRDGNFYRRLCVEDATGGVEIHLGIYDMHSEYPVGLEVALHLKGCATQLLDGVVHIGLPPRSYDREVRDMEAKVVIDSHIIRGVSVAPIAPADLDIRQLTERDCGRFIRVENLYYAPLELDEQTTKIVEYHRFVDVDGAEVYCYISRYATFSSIEFCSSVTSICGILSRSSVEGADGVKYVITPRYAQDISFADTTY